MIWTQQVRTVITIQFDRLIPTFVIGFKFKTNICNKVDYEDI